MILGRLVEETRVLVWKAEDALKLRRSHRIVGNFVGALPCQPHQDIWLGVPLELLPEETTLLLEQGVLQLYGGSVDDVTDSYSDPHQQCAEDNGSVMKKLKMTPSEGNMEVSTLQHVNSGVGFSSLWQFPRTANEKLQYEVFKDLWTRGYHLTSGLKYGGDYLVYPGDPFLVHSHYVALVRGWSEALSAQQLILASRLTTKVKKNALFCSQDPNGEIVYVTIQWTGIT